MPHVSANQFQLVPEISRLGTGFAQGQQFQLNRQQGQRAQAQEGRAVTAEDQKQSELRRGVLNELAINLKSLPFEQRAGAFEQAGDTLRSFNIDPNFFQGANFDDANLDQAIAATGGVDAGRGGASARAFAPVVDPQTGELGVPTFDPETQTAGFQKIAGAPIQQTPEQKRLADIKTKQAISEIDITTTEKKEIIKQRVARTSAIKKELSQRNRNAARSGRTLRQALTLAQTASQGLTGTAKLKLSRLVPGIDASDEAALDATLNQLALDQLQLFKGPTTDFEFGVTQTIAGALGQSKESNIARIKSLDRARFFNERESEQFTGFIKDGGDPDNFRFNFSEVVKTKKGPFTLQDIQDTAVQNNLTIEETIERLNQ